MPSQQFEYFAFFFFFLYIARSFAFFGRKKAAIPPVDSDG